ncbi:hypothetical protein [Sphingomonas sp. CFBP 8760]|uniref:hypothetical protein n=1 Tax=Sphingomonas sp. CFBP 8760 TaxID=2775282 RepID=UPI001780BA69|nr:hypothetical protein [Sphingomonas sp. CFBP 8760]MBD8546016.1 hypothetical protein [Sphingomonas sp. CFBP 8760]
MSLLGYLMQKVGFSSNGEELPCLQADSRYYTASELDSIERELIAGNAAARIAGEKYGLKVNPRIAAANLQ